MPLPSEKALAPRSAKGCAAELAEADPQTLNEFLGEVRESARFVAEFSADLARTPLPEQFGGEQLSEVAQTLFETEMIRRKTFKDYVLLHRLRHSARSITLRAETLALQREKFHFNAAETVLKRFAEIKTIHDNGALPHPEKIAALRSILFAALPPSASDEQDPAALLSEEDSF